MYTRCISSMNSNGRDRKRDRKLRLALSDIEANHIVSGSDVNDLEQASFSHAKRQENLHDSTDGNEDPAEDGINRTSPPQVQRVNQPSSVVKQEFESERDIAAEPWSMNYGNLQEMVPQNMHSRSESDHVDSSSMKSFKAEDHGKKRPCM